MTELFDTHAHLNDDAFAHDRQQALERAGQAGVRGIVEIADSPGDWAKAIALSRAWPSVRCSLGLHPYYADQYSPELVADLKKRADIPEVVAIGEIGLDYVKTDIPRAIQLEAFERLLQACRDWDRPAVIHCRGAYQDLIGVLRRVFPRPNQTHRYHGVVHCFSGTPEEGRVCASLGFALGVDGPVTYPKNDELRRAFYEIGVDSLVLETDSPYLPPQSCRGKRNDPARLAEIAEKLSSVLGISAQELGKATTRNARALYRL
ncbi:MAG: TatD family hydrolase [Elusimicrobia bacterium]|nr:TatD family hydrolase [Elusimicrobiota bacterium]